MDIRAKVALCQCGGSPSHWVLHVNGTPVSGIFGYTLDFTLDEARRSSPVGVTAEMVRAFKAAINDEGYVLFEPIIRSGLEAALGVSNG